jgi:putative hydroxymethylpyrimidine transport system substrate-binding protein
MRQGLLCATLILAIALLSGCGGGQDAVGTSLATTARETRPSFTGEPTPGFPRDLHVSLDGQMTAANVAVLMAVEEGFFADVGLTVSTGAPILPRRPVSYVAGYTDDIAVTQLPQVALAREKGAPIVAVGSLVSEPTAALLWLKKSGIREIADLRNKTIAVPGIPYQEEMLNFILERAGVEPDEVEVKRSGYKVLPALLNGKADAIFGGSWNIEGAALEAQGTQPVIKRVQELGVPSYDELVVITRADRASREPQVVRKFMSALARGVAMVKSDPELASKLIESSPHEFVPSKRETSAQVRATLPLLSPTGTFDPARAEKLLAWMHDEEMIGKSPPISRLLTNRYLSRSRG